jgi:hypothetical protein
MAQAQQQFFIVACLRHIDFRWVLLHRSIRPPMESPKKPAHSVIRFNDAQSAIDGTLDVWLPRLVESNDALEEALRLLRDLYFSRTSLAEEVVLKRVEEALDRAATAKSAF